MKTLTTQSELENELDTQSTLIVGVDLGNASFTASIEGKVKSYSRDEKGIGTMLKSARSAAKRAAERDAQEGEKRIVVVYESTGSISRPFTEDMIKNGMDWVCLYPPRVRKYAESHGQLIKTDKIDARVIEAYAKSLLTEGKLRVNKYVTEKILRLQRIESSLDCLKEHRRDLKNSIQAEVRDKACKQSLSRVLALVEQEIKQLEGEAMKIINGDEELQALYNLYLSEPGVGAETARMLLAEMPELGHIKSKKAAALAGLTTATKSSGQWEKRGGLYPGRRRVRSKMYMCAVAVYRLKGGVLKEFKDRLKAAGKPTKVIMVACAHKLIRILNAKAYKLLNGIPISEEPPLWGMD